MMSYMIMEVACENTIIGVIDVTRSEVIPCSNAVRRSDDESNQIGKMSATSTNFNNIGFEL